MKTRILIFLAAALTGRAFAQGTFRNLNFEETTLAYASNAVGYVSTTDALPGWTVDYGGVPQAQVGYNGIGAAPAVYLWSRGFATIPPVPASLGLFSAVANVNPFFGQGNVSLSQVGTIPDGVNSLAFETFGNFRANSVQVYFGGNLLPLELLPGPDSYYLSWRADLGTLAGQSGELRITALPQLNGPGFFRLDNLQFAPVPEPSTWALITLGSALFWGLTRRRK